MKIYRAFAKRIDRIVYRTEISIPIVCNRPAVIALFFNTHSFILFPDRHCESVSILANQEQRSGGMHYQEIKEFAVKVIREELASAGVSVKQIVLFGSQSRGNSRPDSDWDFLVCVGKELSFPEKTNISAEIQTKLAEKLIDADIIIKSEARLEKERDNVGVITYYALKDGISV